MHPLSGPQYLERVEPIRVLRGEGGDRSLLGILYPFELRCWRRFERRLYRVSVSSPFYARGIVFFFSSFFFVGRIKGETAETFMAHRMSRIAMKAATGVRRRPVNGKVSVAFLFASLVRCARHAVYVFPVAGCFQHWGHYHQCGVQHLLLEHESLIIIYSNLRWCRQIRFGGTGYLIERRFREARFTECLSRKTICARIA